MIKTLLRVKVWISTYQEDFGMNNIELCEKISAALKGSKAKAKKFEDLVAVHFNLLDVSENMYIEVKDGVLSIMPYEYNDRQASVTASTETLEKIFTGVLSMDEAINAGYVKVEGDCAKFKALQVLVPEAKAEQKLVEKKAADKKAPTKKCAKPEIKEAAEPAAKAEAKPETKEAAKPVVKEEAKPAAKAEVKADVKTAPKADAKKPAAKK